MELGIFILLAAAIVALGLYLALGRARQAAPAGSALEGRLGQLAESQAASLGQMAARLQDQERLLGELLEKRLESVAARVTESLDKASQTQSAHLGELRERIARIDAAQANINELSGQVLSLNQILSNKQARGSFGEQQLQDLVASVLPPSAYGFQVQLGAGRRVDCLLTLPNPPGPIAIDAKFPLESYRALREAADEAARTIAARAFRADLSKHIADIAEKYIVPGETADAALMFLPSEAVYAELYANFDEVVQQSFKARVFIVSPTTLWATLNTIRAVLKDVRMRELAGDIQKEVALLLNDVRLLDERVEKLRTHFGHAERDIREIETSTGRVTRRGERIAELEVGDEPAEALPAAQPPRIVQS
ncbi:MAG TPA: DNA recombination protein RmuC [Alphaproteobacteria bacterium]|nr:DNA recombination protein RmuC [Alphaproteobacteria bacterium]